MNLIKVIDKAYSQLEERKWNTIYWCIDLHGTVFKSNYVSQKYEFINDSVLKTLKLISSLPESRIILWSSCYYNEQNKIIRFFRQNKISIFDFNENIDIENTETGMFEEKFYFSIGIDDKFGFEPEIDWDLIYEYLIQKQNGE